MIIIETDRNFCYNISGNSACEKKGVSPIMASQTYVKASLCDDKGTWTVRARITDPVTGKVSRRSKSTGYKVAGSNRRKAEAKMREMVAEWEREANEGAPIGSNPLFRDCVNRWLDTKSLEVRPNTLQSYKVIANAHIIPMLGDIRVRDITRRILQDYFEQLNGRISANSMKKHRVVINGVLEEALVDGIVATNASDHVKLPKVERFEGTALTPEQVTKMLEQCAKEFEPIRSIVILAVVYGMRRSEICGLRWSDIDFDNGILSIRNTVTEYGGTHYEAERTKSKASKRDLCLVESTIPYFKALEQDQRKFGIYGDKVCIYPNGKSVKPAYATRAIEKFLKNCGFEGVRLHDLRHTSATLLAGLVPLKHVQTFLGHESIETTANIYTHTLTADKLKTADSLNEFLKSANFCPEFCPEKPEARPS